MSSAVFKRISISVAVPGLFLAISVLAQTAHAQVYVTDSPRTAVIREIFGTKVVDGLNQLSPAKFAGADAQALDLAQKVKTHEMSVKQGRDALLAVLVKMERGEPLANLPDPSFEIVGVMPVGEAAAGHDVPGAESSMVAAAPQVDEQDFSEPPASEPEMKSASEGKAAPESLDFPEPTKGADTHAADDKSDDDEAQRHVSSI